MNVSVNAQRLAAQLDNAGVQSLDQDLAAFIQSRIDLIGLEATIAELNERHEVALSVGPYIIASESEEGYWCNDFGWVCNRDGATGYELEEVAARGKEIRSLADDARFVSYFATEALFPERDEAETL